MHRHVPFLIIITYKTERIGIFIVYADINMNVAFIGNLGRHSSYRTDLVSPFDLIALLCLSLIHI